jgi:hypothetical protein
MVEHSLIERRSMGMTGRDERIYEEATALWWELFDGPPPGVADGGAILDAIMRRLPETRYERMASPYLRASQISPPRGP